MKIAYFSMEVALKSDVPNYVGGLGVLAADILKSCADLGTPIVGISLMYHEGDDPKYAFDPSVFAIKREETIGISIEDRILTVGVWEHIIKGRKGEVPVYFLDTNLSENTRWDRDITKDLYSLDTYTRLCQEAILGIGGIRMLRELGHDDITVFHMNEGHAALLTWQLMRETEFNDDEVRKQCVFTTHTPVPAGHDRFGYELVQGTLRHKVPWHIKKLAGDNDMNMTKLALNMSRKSNAVSEKHSEVCKKMFPDFDFEAVTNGIHLETWVSDEMAELFDKHLSGWRDDPSKLSQALILPDKELIEAKMKAKIGLLEYVNGQPECFPFSKKEMEEHDLLDPNTLTIVFARRLVPYKRPLFLFQDIDRLRDTCYEDIQVIFAGPYHAGDKFAMETVNGIMHHAKNLRGQIKVAVLPDYDLDIAKQLVKGADVWLNNPQPPMEASGTSGMKSAVNGGLNLSIPDGWWLEGFRMDEESGWAFGWEATDVMERTLERRENKDLYKTLSEVIECYKEHPEEWVSRMKHAISLGAHFNTHRVVKEYEEKMWKL